MKKVLLDMCLFEVLQLRLEYLAGNEPIVELIKNKLVNKVLKYPKTGPIPTNAELN